MKSDEQSTYNTDQQDTVCSGDIIPEVTNTDIAIAVATGLITGMAVTGLLITFIAYLNAYWGQ